MVAVNQYVNSIFNTALPFTMILIALTFGLILMALMYTIGKVSGAHVNPAVSLACLIDGRITLFEFIYYICAQILGGLVGTFALTWIFGSFTSLGANGYETLSALSKITTLPVALGIEAMLTFVFVLVFLSATKKDNYVSGLVVGLTYTIVHIMWIPFTGTGVNPARSIGPAFLTGGVALEQLWVFIVAPLVGGILAALFYKFIITDKEESTVSQMEVEEVSVVTNEKDDKEEKVAVEKKVEKKSKTNSTKKGK